MSDSGELAQDKLDLLRARFQGRLPQRGHAIMDVKLAVLAGDSAGLGELVRLVHSLKGSALQYGFDDLSVQARGLETDLKTLQSQGLSALSEDLLARLDGLVSKLMAPTSS